MEHVKDVIMRCDICGRETNSFIKCPRHPTKLICQEHCPKCLYWTGKETWNCLYFKRHRAQSKAEKTIKKFRDNIAVIDKKIALSKRQGRESENNRGSDV